tara:strand:- start:36 stop:227 length:192 start_codon:yes stop_codon:yes gene_type:complete
MVLNKKLKMNFKERGITVGDLLIFIIVVLISFFSISKIRNDNSQKSLSYFFMNNYDDVQNRNT